MGSTFLQIFLLVNVFLAGVVLTIGLLHARAHFRPAPKSVAKPKPGDFQLSPAIREQLVKEAQAHFQVVTTKSAGDLARKLDATSDQLAGELHKLSQQAALRQAQTFETARTGLATTATEALETVKHAGGEADATLAAKRDELLKTLETEVAEAKRQRTEHVAAEIDSKLSDAVTSYLLEALGHDVDLGSQLTYVLARLNENKDALKAEITG